jgi:hypothetical protein
MPRSVGTDETDPQCLGFLAAPKHREGSDPVEPEIGLPRRSPGNVLNCDVFNKMLKGEAKQGRSWPHAKMSRDFAKAVAQTLCSKLENYLRNINYGATNDTACALT